MQSRPGSPSPLGFSMGKEGANFALYSSHADRVYLGLFDRENRLEAEFPLNRSQDVWHIGISDLPEGLFYAFRCEGKGLYRPDRWLIDPYAKMVVCQRGKASLPQPFDWEGDIRPEIPLSDLIIYEMHVRGFTMAPSSKVARPGTYLGMIEKIPYLKELGINAVELMPIFGFDPHHCKAAGKINYWGYNPLHFFAPSDWYGGEDPVREFKELVKALHRAKIEVILDVVYNHTGEEDDNTYFVHFRGIDNGVYYMLDAHGAYRNYSGCGNTLNANHPAVQQLILDSLRYWIEEMHVDGFRFDLASILTRNLNGRPLDHPPLLEAIRKDPVISKVKLIAEAWDATLYQLGYFPQRGPWSEWNGKYRDVVRKFIKGTDGKGPLFANVLMGSEMIYGPSKTPLSSVNFITSHDGFTLRDLVSYQEKHNQENGEGNRDGNNDNANWNCGCEGETEDPAIKNLRERQMRNFLLALFLSQGIPMLLMGDEYGHTRRGNNNPYVQDNELNWFLWDKKNPKIFSFISSLIRFRMGHTQLRRTQFLTDQDVEWLNGWDLHSRRVAFILKGNPPLFVLFHAHYEPFSYRLPPGSWHLVANTAEDWEFHKNGPPISTVNLLPYSAILSIGKQ